MPKQSLYTLISGLKIKKIKMECDKTNILIILHKAEGEGGSNSSGDGEEMVGDELFGAEWL